MKYDAILFDLDGTLIDTMQIWKEVYLETLDDVGISLTEEEFWPLYRSGFRFLEFVPKRGYKGDVYALQKKRDARYCDRLEQEATWINGARNVLQKIASQYPVAIVTSSHRSYTDAIDKKIELYQVADVLVTSEDVRNVKPDPEPLLFACSQLNARPKNCVYIGDQQCDVAAAKAAEMEFIFIPAVFSDPNTYKEEDKVLGNIQDLLDMLT